MKTVFLAILSFITLNNASAIEVDADAIVAAHNKWRTLAGVTQTLSYSPELAKSAQVWADKLKWSNHCQMRHSPANGLYGENLYWASPVRWSNGKLELQSVSAEKVVDSWGSEKDDYDYQSNRCLPGKMCGHYTQMVWHTTTKVGCAVAVCENTLEQVWACQYQPTGNWVGSRPY